MKKNKSVFLKIEKMSSTTDLVDGNNDPSSSVDLIATIYGNFDGALSQVQSEIMDQGFDVLANKIPVSTRCDYSIKPILPTMSMWRCCQIINSNNKNETESSSSSYSEDRIHFLRYQEPTNKVFGSLRPQFFFSDVIIIPVPLDQDSSLENVWMKKNAGVLNLLASPSFNAAIADENDDATFKRRHVVLIFAANHDAEKKKQLEVAFEKSVPSHGNAMLFSSVQLNSEPNAFFKEMKKILIRIKSLKMQNNNNNNNNVPIAQ